MSAQDGEEFPAGQRLMNTNVEDESSVDLGSEEELFNEEETDLLEENEEESGDVPYPLTLVRGHPAGLRVVNIDRDTCGCIMMTTLQDGTKSPTVCTKPVTICNRHSSTQRQTRSVQGTGTLLVETDATKGLKSEFPPGRPSGGLCMTMDPDTDSSSIVEDVTPGKAKRRSSGRRVGTPDGFFNERDPTSAINNNILSTNNNRGTSHSPVGRKKTGKPKSGSPASLQTSLSKASFNPIIGMENEFGQRTLVFSPNEQLARQNERYDPIESFSSKVTAAEWLSLAPNTVGLKQPPRKSKPASRTRKSGRNNGGNGGVSILRQPKYQASSEGRTQYTREELLATRAAKKKKENKKKKEKKKSRRSKLKVDFSDSDNLPSDSSASTRSRVTMDPDPDSDPESSDPESDSSASTSSSESSRDTSRLFDFPDNISVSSSSSSSSSSSDDSSRDSDSTTEAKKKRKKKKKKKKKKTHKDSKLERKLAKSRKVVLQLQNEQAKRRGAKSISLWKPDKSNGKSGSVFGVKISNTPKINDLLYPAGSSGEEFAATMLDVCSLGSNKGMYNTDEQSSTATELVDSFRALRTKALPRVCKQNTTFNRINREGLSYFVTGDAEHFHSLVQVIQEEYDGMLEQQSEMVIEYLTHRKWRYEDASEFAETGGFPSLIALIKGLYFDLLLKLQRQITMYGMDDGPFRPTFDYHAKKLMQIRRSAVSLPKMYLAQYVFMRNSKADNFEHHRMYHGMWNKLKEVDAKADFCMMPVQRDTRRVLPAKDAEEVRCLHCRSVELHRAFKPLAPGDMCPLHEVHTTKARKVARLVMVAFKADAATTSIGSAYIQPFIDASNAAP